MNLDAIRKLEQIADSAYPAECVEVLDGWLLRAGGELGRRVNSVAPLAEGSLPLDEKIDQAEAWYRDRGRPPMFKLTAAAAPPHLDASLAGRGYREDAAVVVMTCGIVPGGRSPCDVELSDEPDRAWRRALMAFGGKSAARVTGLPDLISRASGPAAYASVAAEGRIVGVSLGVTVERHLGLFEVFVDAEHRGHGVGHRMMEALTAWGVACGAQIAFLQVEEGNHGGRAFYRALGFGEAHRYWYRVGV